MLEQPAPTTTAAALPFWAVPKIKKPAPYSSSSSSSASASDQTFLIPPIVMNPPGEPARSNSQRPKPVIRPPSSTIKKTPPPPPPPPAPQTHTSTHTRHSPRPHSATSHTIAPQSSHSTHPQQPPTSNTSAPTSTPFSTLTTLHPTDKRRLLDLVHQLALAEAQKQRWEEQAEEARRQVVELEGEVRGLRESSWEVGERYEETVRKLEKARELLRQFNVADVDAVLSASKEEVVRLQQSVGAASKVSTTEEEEKRILAEIQEGIAKLSAMIAKQEHLQKLQQQYHVQREKVPAHTTASGTKGDVSPTRLEQHEQMRHESVPVSVPPVSPNTTKAETSPTRNNATRELSPPRTKPSSPVQNIDRTHTNSPKLKTTTEKAVQYEGTTDVGCDAPGSSLIFTETEFAALTSPPAANFKTNPERGFAQVHIQTSSLPQPLIGDTSTSSTPVKSATSSSSSSRGTTPATSMKTLLQRILDKHIERKGPKDVPTRDDNFVGGEARGQIQTGGGGDEKEEVKKQVIRLLKAANKGGRESPLDRRRSVSAQEGAAGSELGAEGEGGGSGDLKTADDGSRRRTPGVAGDFDENFERHVLVR
ncbi:hypothetical protein HK102_008140, partial [Quaeritorhiza haematococci]